MADQGGVGGRRQVRFTSFDEVMEDAERLVASPRTRTLGKWPLGPLLAHLGRAIDYSLAGKPFLLPWYVRFVASFRKRRYLTHGLPPGVRLPKEKETLAFPETTPGEGLAALRAAVARAKEGTMGVPHPAFGRLTHEEWTLMHLRHAELHLSHAVEG
jgi:hypothetical protein